MSEILRAGETEKDGTDEVDNAHKVFGDVLCRVISDADIIIHEAFLVFECVPFFATVDDVLDAKRSDHCLIRSSLPIPCDGNCTGLVGVLPLANGQEIKL